jgi:hypothetical protein
MIQDWDDSQAREVRPKPKVRKVLEAHCRAPTTAQRDVKRARIVLLAAEGRSTRSIAEEVGVEPRIVSTVKGVAWGWFDQTDVPSCSPGSRRRAIFPLSQLSPTLSKLDLSQAWRGRAGTSRACR